MRYQLRRSFYRIIISLGAFLGFTQCVIAQYGAPPTDFRRLQNVERPMSATGVIYGYSEKTLNLPIEGLELRIAGSYVPDTLNYDTVIYSDRNGNFAFTIPPELIMSQPMLMIRDVDGSKNGLYNDTAVEIRNFGTYVQLKQQEEKKNQEDESNNDDSLLNENDAAKKPKEALPVDSYKPNNIVFLLDISMSMKDSGKMDYLKTTMIELLKHVRDIDKITLVAFSSEAEVLMETISGSEKDKMTEIVESLHSKMYTCGSKGMKLAYKKAVRNKIKDGNNQVIMITDGGFNIGPTIVRDISARYLRKDVKMSVVGIKPKQTSKEELKMVAKNGLGEFILVESEKDAENCLIQEIKKQSKID